MWRDDYDATVDFGNSAVVAMKIVVYIDYYYYYYAVEYYSYKISRSYLQTLLEVGMSSLAW